MFYIPRKENQKVDSFTVCPNNLPIDDTNDCQQHLLQTIFPMERLEIGSIKGEKNRTINKQVVQTNLKDSYYSKLRNALKTDYLIKEIDSRHFYNLSVNSENCICQFGRL